MAIYRTGQASMDAQGYITGYGTKWREQLTLIRAGATIIFLSNPLQFGVITEVVNDTSMRAITTNGAVVAKTNYIILLHDSLTVDGLAQDVAETLRYYQGKESEIAHFIEFLEDFDFAKLESLTNQTKDAAAKAKTSETNAKASENAALASKNAAKTSETNAKASETAANNSKNAAKTSETNAKTSETNAASSKTAAANSATAAKESQDAAKVSETNAANSKTAAANSASAAKTSETNAENSKTAAANSASAAKTSETNANNSKNAAKTSETNAKTSETNAKASENKAKEYADKASLIANPLTQYNWPTGTGAEEKFVKIAKLTDPGSADCHVTLMITNGGSYGSRFGSIDFLDASARGLGTTTITASNVRQFMQIRRIGDPNLAEDNQMRYGVVKGDGFFEIWAYQRAFINNVKVAILAKAGRAELYIPNGYVSQTSAPDGWVKSVAIRVYDEANKPSKSDVGLSNVTNDAQVKKVGDTMTGDLDITKGNASLHLKSTGGTSHVWFKNGNGSERGVIWAPANTASSGEVRIRARNTAGATGGEFIFDSAGKMTANGIQVNGKVSSRTVEVNNPDTATTATTIRVNGSQHTPIIFERQSYDSNLSIGFKLKDKNLKRLGVDKDGDLSYGEMEDQKQNSKLVTLKMLNADQTIGGAYIFSKAVTFKAGFAGEWEAVVVDGQELDLNSLVIKRSDVGTVRFYQCSSAGGGNNITNKPSGVSGNFIIRLESVRKVGDRDYTCRQLLYSSDTSRQYERYCSNGTWSAWRENVVSGMNQDVSVKTLSASGRLSGGELAVGGNGSFNGNIGVGGANPAQSSKGIYIGNGSSLVEGADGKAVISSSGKNALEVSLRPGGIGGSDNAVSVKATATSGGDTKIEFGQGAAISCNASGSPIISAKAGQMIYLRPGGDTASEGQVTIGGSGEVAISNSLTVNGNTTLKATTINGNATVSGSVTANGGFNAKGKLCNFGALEIYNATPYIDFHYGNAESDYTARIIQDSASQVTIEAPNLRMSGATVAMGVVRGANEVAFSAWAYSDPAANIGQIRIAPRIESRFNTAGGPGRTQFWFEEHVGQNHRAVVSVDGYGATTQYWHFRSDGQIWGSARGDVAWAGTSDLRYKDNVVDYDGLQSLENIKAMNLIKFTYKNDEKKRERRGVAAQQIREIDPCYVKESNGSYKDENGETVEVNKLVLDTNPLLMDALCAIKALSAQVDELKEEIRKLKGE
nr:MAG: chaperone of endosialidase [Bacteriophage sp.]